MAIWCGNKEEEETITVPNEKLESIEKQQIVQNTIADIDIDRRTCLIYFCSYRVAMTGKM
jgi:hypothetical protein